MPAIDREVAMPSREPSTGAPYPDAPVRIHTLGRFEVRVRGRPLALRRKAPARLLDLLKAIIAGGGRAVRDTALTDLLWPEADGDAAQGALNTALHRLRRLLGHPRALRHVAGTLGLDPEVCWLDVWALETRLTAADFRGRDLEARSACLAEARALHAGPFLPADLDRPWTEPLRARLRDRLLRHLVGLGASLEAAGAHDRAVAAFEEALDVDATAEEPYRRLIAAYLGLGRAPEALRTYVRCRSALATAFGVEPSPDIEAAVRLVRPWPAGVAGIAARR
jgi:DNA-binding SARP family transcriptional activator